MSETIANRVGRLISGSVNAVIDALENAAPEVVLEQIIREIDAATDEVRAELGKVVASKYLANKRLLEENRKHEELSERIELALKEGREDLAEAAVARQFDIEAQLPVLEGTIADGQAKQKELEGYTAALQARRREMEGELAQFRAAQAKRAAAAAGSSSGAPDSASAGTERRVANAESAFARVLSKAGGVPIAEHSHRDGAKLAELEDLSRKNRIRERLESIKAKQRD